MSKSVLKLDTSGLDKLGNLLGTLPDELNQAVASSLNKFKDETQAELCRLIPGVYAIPKKNIRSAFKRGKKKRTLHLVSRRHQVSIEVVGKALSLARFEHTPEVPDRNAYPVRARVLQSSALTPLSRPPSASNRLAILVNGWSGKQNTRLFNPFIAPTSKKTGKGMRYTIFRRTGKTTRAGKPAMESISTITIPQMMTHPQVAEPLLTRMSETMETMVTKEVEVRLKAMEQAEGKGGS